MMLQIGAGRSLAGQQQIRTLPLPDQIRLATELLQSVGEHLKTSWTVAPQGTQNEAEAPELTPRALRAMIRARRERDAHFGARIFGEPAWDMLLDLMLAHLEGKEVSVSSLCIAAAVPSTTALRWIATMVDNGLFDRTEDKWDHRRALISLSDRGLQAFVHYWAKLRILHPTG